MAIRADNQEEFAVPEIAAAEHVKEGFPYNYLPVRTRQLLREAFACYAADLFLAFAVLCRRSLAAAAGTGSASNLAHFRTLFEDAITIGQINAGTRDILRDVLFGSSAESEITAEQAAILIEVVKDIFFQRYVRTAKLRRAIQVRQLFADGVRQPD
jgi:hypothetical protein